MVTLTKIGIIGGGNVGSFVASYLKKHGFELNILDLSEERARSLGNALKCEWSTVDVRSPDSLKKSLHNADLVINAVPGSYGYQAVVNIVKQGFDTIDVSFFPEDPSPIDEIAKESGVTAIVDAGIAPGLSNMLTGAGQSMLGGITELKIYVGGVTEVFNPPFGVVAGFNTLDLVDEYRRPARYLVNGVVKSLDPLIGDIGIMNVEGVGQLEYFQTDGLRSLLRSYPDLEFAGEYTLRWPGHLEFMRGLNDIGLLSHTKLRNGAYSDESLALSIANTRSGLKDKLVLVVEVFNKDKEVKFSQIVKPEDSFTAMAKSTGGFLAFTTVEFLNGKVKEKGLVYPEKLGTDPSISVSILERFAEEGMAVNEAPMNRHNKGRS